MTVTTVQNVNNAEVLMAHFKTLSQHLVVGKDKMIKKINKHVVTKLYVLYILHVLTTHNQQTHNIFNT